MGRYISFVIDGTLLKPMKEIKENRLNGLRIRICHRRNTVKSQSIRAACNCAINKLHLSKVIELRTASQKVGISECLRNELNELRSKGIAIGTKWIYHLWEKFIV